MYNTCPSVCVYARPKEHQRFCRVQSSPSSCAEVTLVSLCFAFHVSLVFFLWAEMCPRLSNMLTATLWSGGAWLTFKRTFPRRQLRFEIVFQPAQLSCCRPATYITYHRQTDRRAGSRLRVGGGEGLVGIRWSGWVCAYVCVKKSYTL